MNLRRFPLAVFLCLVCNARLLPQATGAISNDKGHSKTDEERVEEQWQTLEWTADDSVLFYEVIVEEREKKSGKFIERVRRTVAGEEHSVKMDPLLPSGEYRYKVIAYNLLNLKSYESDWASFSITAAKQPAIRNVSIAGGVITITGKNLFPDGDEENTLDATHYELINQNTGKSYPLKAADADGQTARLDASSFGELDAGTYRVLATDSSGLASKENSGTFTIKEAKKPKASIAAANASGDVANLNKVNNNSEESNNSNGRAGGAAGVPSIGMDKEQSDVTASNNADIARKPGTCYGISACYACPFAMKDDTDLFDYEQPLSAMLRASVTSSKSGALRFGTEMSVMYTRIITNIRTNGGKRKSKNGGNMAVGNMLFVCQLPLPNCNTMIETRLGGGLMFLEGLIDDTSYGYFLDADAGASFQFFVSRGLYAEIGCDYIMSVMNEGAVGFVVPSFGLGYRFKGSR